MNLTGSHSFHAAAELGDPDDYSPPDTRPRCRRCGAYLPHAADSQGFDHERDDYYEDRLCRHCGHGQRDWVY